MAQGPLRRTTMMRKNTAIAWTAFALAAVVSGSLRAQSLNPTGTWFNENKDAIVQIGDCGVLAAGVPTGTLCGVVAWLERPIDPATGRPPTDRNNVDPAKRSQPLMGMQVISQMRPSATAGRWDGSVYSVDDGKTFDGSLIVRSETQMRVQGCVLIICRGEEWTRQALPEPVKPPTPGRPTNSRPPPSPPAPAQPRAR
jgi:uncharacterized protein (DUF2147 family)